ncbi:cytochrome P450 [Catenulispora rubra]|uniref:cytochrome P450 n=1 Tax=Catenulispora rubra TaxID=280293 RepID=UPI0018925C89|nr:cytochrome P450 [Catenulispora rubra]
MPKSPAIPVAPGAVPILGHLPKLARDPLSYLDTLGEHGGLLTLRLGAKRMIVVCDPTLVHQMLVADDVFDKGGPFFASARRLMPTGVGLVEHDRHRRLRKLMQPSFTRVRLSGYGRIMTREITSALAGWQDGQELDAVPELMAITGRVLIATMFSGSVPEATMRQIMIDSTELTRGLLIDTALPAPLARLTPGYGRYRAAVARLREVTLQLITERRNVGPEAASQYSDLLQTLLTRGEDGGDGEEEPMSDSELVDQLTFMLVAGTETTAQTMAWALYQMSVRPEIEMELHAEIDAALAGRDAAEYEDVAQLKLTNRIVTETLRYYSPAWIFTRQTSVDTELGGYPIKAGTDILYSPYIINRMPSAHDHARTFDPERWQPERAAKCPREANIPFSTGARKCLGDQFSLVESALILATVAAGWRLEAVPGTELRTSRKTVVTPQGLKLRAVRRERKQETETARGSAADV